MSFARPHPPCARALAAACTAIAALALTSDVAAALPSARRGASRTTHRAHSTARARLHASSHASSHAHAKARARWHTRRHALATVASASAASEAGFGGASLRGSHEAVDRAYDAAVRDGIPFVHSKGELEQRANAGEYVALQRSTGTYQLKGVGSPYVRAATRNFVTSFAANYARTCGEPLTVTSAMRPTTVHLRNSVQKSVHPTGMAVDLRASRTGCRDWMRTALLGLERQGMIDATEEHHPAHFHVVVLRNP